MSNRWINRIVFWLLCALPLVALVLASKSLGSFFFYNGLMCYVFLYRPFIHINRLMQLRAIEEKEAWRLFVPFYHTRYFRQLWFG